MFYAYLRFCLTFAVMGFAIPAAHALVVLQYHHVSTTAPSSTSITPELFNAHLEIIEAAKFNVIDIRQVAKTLRAGKALPDRSVVISFDDGYRSIYSAAFPELKRRKWPFTVFVNTDPHDQKNPQYMSWGQLRELSAAGAVIANHSRSHAHLIRGAYALGSPQSEALRRAEILQAQSRIDQEIGSSEKLFAYPYGEYDKHLQALLASQGYIAFGQQSGPVAKTASLQAIPRFPFGGPYGDVEDFKTKLYSLAFPQARISTSSEKGLNLAEPLLAADVRRPILRLASPILPHIDPVDCFASGQGRIKSERKGSVVIAQAKRDLPVGRSRYNCTAKAGGGRYYWYSKMFIRKREDGSWLAE